MNTAAIPIANVEKLTDLELLNLCEQFGKEALEARRKFIGLLPEVFKRKLYLRKFTSIFHFAAVTAGVSEEQVRVALNLKKQFEDKPMLHQLLVSGTVSVNKLARVASVVTPENEHFWAAQVTQLSNRAVETLVRDERMHVHSNPQQDALLVKEPTLSLEVKKKLVELEEKGIDINAELLTFLKQREEEIAAKKEAAAQALAASEEPAGRHVPVAIDKIVSAEFGTKCAIETCYRPSQELHHTSRFSLARSHDPHFLAPLCKAHHEIAHSIDAKYRAHKKAPAQHALTG